MVLECVDRLLGKGYKPQDIILEDSWKLGHKVEQKIVSQIQEIEQKIEILNQVLDSTKTQKEAILKKYL